MFAGAPDNNYCAGAFNSWVQSNGQAITGSNDEDGLRLSHGATFINR